MARPQKKLSDAQEVWENKIARAKEVRKNWRERFQTTKAREYYENRQNDQGWAEDDWLTINKIKAWMDSRLPSLYSMDPFFYVKLKRSYSTNPMDAALWDQKGNIRGAFLNYIKEEDDLKSKGRLGIFDAHFEYGILKSVYRADEQENPEAGEPIMDDDGAPVFGDEGPLMQPESLPVNERYTWLRIHPDDFLADEDAGPLGDNWNWLAQRIRITLDEARQDKRFNKQVLKSLEKAASSDPHDEEEKLREERKKGGDIKGRSERYNERKAKKEPDNLVTIWEIYDLRKKVWHKIAEGADVPLMYDEPLPPGVEDHPFSILRFSIRDDSFYPYPPLTTMIDLQREYNLTRSRMVRHRKRFNRKYEVNMTAMGPDADDELSKLESGEDGTIIKKHGASGEKAVQAIQDAPLDQSTTIQELALTEREMTEMGGGQTAEARGIARADSATQAAIMDRRMEIKEGDQVSMVLDWLMDAAKKMDQLVQANITGEEAVKIAGPEGEMWQLVREDDYQDINGEYEYSVNAGSTIPRIPQTEMASFMAILQLFANAPQLMLSERLVKKVAEMHHVEDESMVQELMKIAQMIMGGQMQQPTNQGTPAAVPGASPGNPIAAMLGSASGSLSLNQPGAGNIEG